MYWCIAVLLYCCIVVLFTRFFRDFLPIFTTSSYVGLDTITCNKIPTFLPNFHIEMYMKLIIRLGKGNIPTSVKVGLFTK